MLFRRLTAVVLATLLMAMLPGAIAAGQSPSPEIRMIPIESLQFGMRLSPDGTTAAVFELGPLHDYATDDPALLSLRLIDLASGQEVGSAQGSTDYVADAAFNPDGTKLASWHTNGDLVVWDLTGGQLQQADQFRMGTLGNVRVTFMPDGKTLMAMISSTPTWFRLVDTETGATTVFMGPPIASFGEFMERNPGPPYDLQYAAMAVSPDGSTLASATFNGEVALWDIPGGEPRTLRPPSEQPGRLDVRQLTFSSDESLLYFDDSDDSLHAWDLASETETGSLEVAGVPFAGSPTSTGLAWAESTADDRTSIGMVDLGGSIAPYSLAVLDGRPVPGITSLSYTPDGSTIVVGGLYTASEQNAIALIPAPW
jgi:WD40 repeat protein